MKIKIRKAEIISEVREKEKDVKGVTERQCSVQKMFAMSVWKDKVAMMRLQQIQQ